VQASVFQPLSTVQVCGLLDPHALLLTSPLPTSPACPAAACRRMDDTQQSWQMPQVGGQCSGRQALCTACL